TDRAALVARRTARAEAGRLRIGVGYCMDLTEVSKVVSAFTAENDNVRVELRTMAVPDQFTALRDERLDIGFVRPPVLEASLHSEVLAREPLMAALPANH